MNWFRKVLGTSRAQGLPAASAADTASSLPAGAVLVDVRSPDEFDSGHLEGAVSLPLDRIQFDIARAVPERTTPLVLYCRSGARSGRACTLLAEMGYGQVTNGGAIGSLALRLNRTLTVRR